MGPPCCKPLRIIQLLSVAVGFCFLFLLRKHDFRYDTVTTPGILIYFFTCYGSLLILTGADVFTQMVKQPISNVSIAEVLVAGAIFCLIAGIIALVLRNQHDNCNALITLNALTLLSVISFFSTIVYVFDFIILVRFA